MDIRKTVGYAVVGPAPAIALSKSVGYAVINASSEVLVRKAVAYAVVHDPSVDVSTARSWRLIGIGMPMGL